MNATTIGIALGLIGIIAFVLGRSSAHGSRSSGVSGDTGSARDLERRAEADNRELADAERGTAETIREQAGDIERAGENATAAGALIKRGKEILNAHNNSK